MNERNSDMKTRKPEKFHVQHANTDKLQNFALVYMQNLVKENERTNIKVIAVLTQIDNYVNLL